MTNRNLLPLLFVGILIGLIVPTIVTVKAIKFNQNCGGYIKQAADANSVELSLSRLETAINYAEINNLTSGYTSVLWKTEDENIGFWYKNLVACRDELKLVVEKEDATQLEKSNILMKVRESLMDNHGDKGDEITVPDGISRYPHNALFGVFRILSFLMLFFCVVGITAIINEW